METHKDGGLILWCAVPVTNDMPQALFPNIDTARNNMAGFSQMKAQGGRRLPGPHCMCMFSSILCLDFHVVHLSQHTHTCTHDMFVSLSNKWSFVEASAQFSANKNNIKNQYFFGVSICFCSNLLCSSLVLSSGFLVQL